MSKIMWAIKAGP